MNGNFNGHRNSSMIVREKEENDTMTMVNNDLCFEYFQGLSIKTSVGYYQYC